MIEDIRAEMAEVLSEREGAGRADLLVLMHPDTRREILQDMDTNPDRIAGISIQYSRDVEEREFELVWKSEFVPAD